MMLGLQGNTSSSKVYRCVACSATFTGLASLLVHQATHASALSKVSAPPSQPNMSPHETMFASTDSNSEHRSSPALLPECPSPSFYICDCGEEFHDFNLMLEHKRSHTSSLQLQPPLNNNAVSSETGCGKMIPTQHAQLSPPLNQTESVLSCPSTSKSPALELPTLSDHEPDVSLGDGAAIVTTPLGGCTPSQADDEKQLDSISAGTEQIAETVKDLQDQDIPNVVPCSEKGEYLPKNNTVMKLLASAYKRFSLPEAPNESDNTVFTKQEVVPVDIMPVSKTKATTRKDLSITQIRRLLTKPGIKTKAPPISKILESSKKKVVSLTKTFSPVVVLETRQKLVDPKGIGTYGGYQCGRCRRTFLSLDKLTEHHFLHKKERIKCCRRCKQLIIGRLPLPDNHVCPQLGNKSKQPSISLRNNLPFCQKLVPFHSLGSTKKVYFCPLCKHSYARRWNLKTHKCQGQRSSFSLQTNHSFQKMLLLKSSSKTNRSAEFTSGCQSSRNVAVGTEVSSRIKVEVTSPSLDQSAVSQLAWTHPAKTFLPFYTKSSMLEQDMDVSLSGVSLQEGEENSWNAAEADNEDSNEGQWTMPLDDEMEMHTPAGKASDNTEVIKPDKPAETTPAGLRYFVKDGVKRYPCNRCQKTYSRPSTLRRHLRLCGFRPRGLGTVAHSGSQGAITLNTHSQKPMFACFVCGKNFNRKDNMMVHRKRCQMQRTMAGADGETVQQNLAGKTDIQTQDDDDRSNWGFMSLPSVLPRRVTCECGAGFTCPKLLLEHLKKHAQESYTCPTCGETVNCWAEYEVHLQIHMRSQRQMLKGLQPRSQPLLLRFQQQPPQTEAQFTPKQPRSSHFSFSTKKQQRIVCNRCGNTFATRCSLRKHITWNRCKGVRFTNAPSNPPKTYHCSHCNSDFPNSISLLFHQRSGACKPAVKPVRCPVCLRWFGTEEGLQKHMLTHKHTEMYRCDVCQGTYPNLKSLKNHRRRIHRILVGGGKPVTQEQLSS